MPKKALIFSTSYYPFVAGAEVAVKEITDRIPDIQFDLITAKMKKGLPFREKIGNVMVYRLGVGVPIIDKLILPFEGALFARHLSKKNNYDLFWCIMASFGSGAGYIKNIFSYKNIPIVLTLQEGDSEEHFRNRWFGLINLSWKLALKRTKILTVLSQYLKDRAIRLGYRREVSVVPNGVNVDKFSMEINKEEKIKIRKELGLVEENVVLVTTSRLTKKNGIEDVIKALPKLSTNIKFVIFGEGELEEELKNLAKSLDVSDRVIWRGYVSHDEMPKYLKACDIFIRPSLSEGFGNSFIEAMACRLPVIATPVGGIVDFLKDPTSQSYDGTSVQTGYFCKPEDPESIVSTVSKILSDPNKNQIIENAYRMVLEKYDWNLVAKQMKEVFEKVQ